MSQILKIPILTLKKSNSVSEIVGEVSGAKIESSMDNTFGDMEYKTEEDEKEQEEEEEEYQVSEENKYAQFDNNNSNSKDAVDRYAQDDAFGDVDVSYDFDEDGEAAKEVDEDGND